MSIAEIIRAWKADEQDQQDEHMPENPAGYALSDEDLEQVVGGGCFDTCANTCAITCIYTGNS